MFLRFTTMCSMCSELFVSSMYIPTKFLFSQPSETVVCVSVFICRYMWVAYVNKWLWCDTWTIKTVFKNESHCSQNNPAHCTCVGAWQSWFASGHTRTQIWGMLPKNTFSCGQADKREMGGSKSRDVWSTSAELRGEASWKCCKVQEDHSTHCNSQHLVKFVHWPTFQQLQLIRGSKPYCSSYLWLSW